MNIHFTTPDGRRLTCAARPGETVMQVAVANNIETIIAECGGAMVCATCHCHVAPEWLAATGPRGEVENDMLDCIDTEVTAESRLSCQIRLSPELDGLVIRLVAR